MKSPHSQKHKVLRAITHIWWYTQNNGNISVWVLQNGTEKVSSPTCVCIGSHGKKPRIIFKSRAKEKAGQPGQWQAFKRPRAPRVERSWNTRRWERKWWFVIWAFQRNVNGQGAIYAFYSYPRPPPIHTYAIKCTHSHFFLFNFVLNNNIKNMFINFMYGFICLLQECKQEWQFTHEQLIFQKPLYQHVMLF